MNLHAAFETVAQKNPGKTAIFWGPEVHTYGNVAGAMRRWSSLLASKINPGDRVGLLMKNRPEFIPALFGILRAGGVAVPINNFLKPGEIDFILRDAGIRVVIGEASMAPVAEALQNQLPGLEIITVEHFLGESCDDSTSPASAAAACESDLAIVIYTSGTTGHPKGAMLTHGNLLHNVNSCEHVLDAMENDRFALLLPMFHSFMLCVGILLPLLVGASIVLVKSLHPPKNVILEILERKATVLPAIPQFFRALLDPSVPANLPLRLCVSGAAPLPVQILKDFNAKFPLPLIEGYGLSEASPVVCMNPIQGPWKAGSVGLPIPNVELAVQDESGRELPAGQTGEFCVRGGNVMIGYWNQPEETSRVLRDGWLLTGDVGHKDADGYAFITDRKKDMLLVNGINVYPREIEEWIYQFPGIKEAAVVGVPDRRKGEHPVVFLVTLDGAAIDEIKLIQMLRSHVAGYKVPKHIYYLPALPRNATGKILKTALRAICAQQSQTAA
jgi:long-chain acyl-CoA synthetase